MFITLIILLIIAVIKANSYQKHLPPIKEFNKLIEIKRKNYINVAEIPTIKTKFSQPFEYFTKQLIKTSSVKEFLNTYTNLDTLAQKWNQEYAEKEKYSTNIEHTQAFFDTLENYKTTYFSTTMRDALLNNFKSLYNYFTSEIMSKYNLVPPQNFIQSYSNLNKLVTTSNFNYIRTELAKYNNFFTNIDNKSLDYQQRTAVITDDTNNLILAGAGSGKTLTIAAKVKYLVECKNINPSEILLIAFTKKSATEMTERINTKLEIPINAVTFHKLGLNILKNYKNFNVIDNTNEIISEYFKNYILNDPSTIKNILEFFLYYLNIPQNVNDFDSLGAYIENQRTADFETLKSKYNKNSLLHSRVNDMKHDLETIQGERVRSIEEVMIANFLFMNGVKYEYKKEYPFKSDDKYHRSYHPDFYLTDYDIYLEHFGISKDGTVHWLPEIEAKKYVLEMEWKREFHKENGTTLIETYSYYNTENRLLNELKKLLENNHIKLTPIDMQDVYEKVYSQNEDYHFKEFEKLVSTFIQLYKANGYTINDLNRLTPNTSTNYLHDRNNAFINIVKPILIYYENELKKQNGIDFNDMINLATNYINNEDITFPYKYIIIDEYQDISVGRYKLIKALINKTKAKLICVGDDWQSIYRFSGSDLDLFSNFQKYFGETAILKIEKTYRNSQELLDIATHFIEKNPQQLKKNLMSDKSIQNPIMVMAYSQNEKLALYNTIDDIYMHFGENAEILLLGRTTYDINNFVDANLKYFPATDKVHYNKYPNMSIRFLTVHSSKGLEAENVIILNLKNALLGFPNKISDDPVLSMVLQNKDEFAFAEERRLFYVAITRTRNKTYLIAPSHHYSLFLDDLKKITNLNIYMNKGEENIASNPNCPRCKKGYLVIRNSDKGMFLGCTNYPYCNYKINDIDVLDSKIKCERCGGYLVKRNGKYGEFLGCSNYPYCENTGNNNKQEIGFKRTTNF